MNNWGLWLIAGIVSLLGGLFALANPMAATLSATLLAGYMFMVVGALTVVSAFQASGWGGRIWALLFGLVMFLMGFHLVGEPLKGTLTLTFAAAILMLTAGLFRILMAFAVEGGQVRMILILSGVISLLLGGMILSNFPQSATVVLGLFLAIELISNGVSLIVLSLGSRKAA
ncbi:HdeD family acid-resistance protein [Roseovarius sp. EL26]|uniref:HdeD family acid-resistance protein n=1 Tax=Roseovarius sp. EL26 TaxID=2126672 RepID=UPI000EA0962C|nr:DUF308 domain-containing protein [Roseovarius sp. EL26]